MKNLLKEKRGVAGLNVFLALISMLFMIGIIVMVYQIAGSKLMDSARDSTNGAIDNETLTNASLFSAGGYDFSVATLTEVGCTITDVRKATGTNGNVVAGNYTQTNCNLKNSTATWGSAVLSSWNVSYNYVYMADNDATRVINDTKESIKTSTEFFSTFITLGAMVVLVLLVVIIINSIRQTGITEGA